MKVSRRILLLVGLLASAMAAVSCIGPRYPELPRAEVADYPVEQYELPSGLRVVLERSPDFGRAGAVLIVGAGASADPMDKSGAAHLTEHLAMKARHRGGPVLKHLWRALGAGSTNAATSWDDTAYYGFVPPQNLEAMLASLAGVLSNPLEGVTAAAFENSRQVVLNETRQVAENGAPRQALGWLAEKVFPHAHAYHHPVSGRVRDLSAIQFDDIRAFGRAHYRTQASTLVVSAPLPTKALRAMVRRAFPTEPGSKRPRPAQQTSLEIPKRVLEHHPGGMSSHQAPVATPELWIGWSVPGAYSGRGDVPHVIADMVKDTFWWNLGRRDADIARVIPGFVLGAEAGMFYLRVVLKRGTDPESSARSAAREMRRGLAKRSHHAMWLEATKRAVAVNATYAHESMVSRVMSIGYSTHHVAQPDFHRRRDARLIALTDDAVSDYCKKYLDVDRAHTILIRPPSDGSQTARVAPESSSSPAENLPGIEPAPMPDRAEVRRWMRPIPLGGAVRASLDTGLEVIAVPHPGSRYHTLILGFHGGDANIVGPGVGTAAEWAMEPTRISPRVRGMAYHRTIALDATTYALRSTGTDIRRSLEALQKASSDFQVDWPPRQFTHQLQVFEAEDRQPSSELAHSRSQALFGSHAYGHLPRPKEVRAVTGTQVYKWINQVLRPENGVLVMVGDFDPRKAAAMAREEFSSLRASDKKRRQVPSPSALRAAAARSADRLLIRHQAGRTQVETHFECVLPPVTAKSAPVGTLFAQMLQHRVEHVLREKLGVTYSVFGRVDYLRGGTALLRLESELSYDQLALALGVFRKYLEQPSGGLLDAVYLERARAAIARGYNLELSTTAAIASAIFSFWNRGWSVEDIDRFRERVLQTRLDDVRAVSQHCRDNWVIGMLGDQTRIRAAWARAGN